MTIQASPTAFQFVFMALAIDKTDGRGPSIEACRELLVKKLGYFPRLSHSKNVYQLYKLLTRQSNLSFKTEWVCHAGEKAYKRRLAYTSVSKQASKH